MTDVVLELNTEAKINQPAMLRPSHEGESAKCARLVGAQDLPITRIRIELKVAGIYQVTLQSPMR